MAKDNTRVGIIGLGMMGRTHYEAYQKLPNVQVVAVTDENPKRAAGDLSGTAGNVLEAGLTSLPMDRIKGFTDYREMFKLADLDDHIARPWVAGDPPYAWARRHIEVGCARAA